MAIVLTGCAQAPTGVQPITVAHAAQLGLTDRQAAITEYQAVISRYNSSNPELAAQAAYDEAVYASSPTGYASPALLHITGTPTKAQNAQIEQLASAGNQIALQALQNIQQHYGNTTTGTSPDTATLFKTVNNNLDRENSGETAYQIMNALVQITGNKPGFSYWFALLIIAVAIKLVTLPAMVKQIKSQKEMQNIAPFLKDLQTRHKAEPQVLWQKQQELYKEHGVNPFASCLPVLIQLPVFWLMFYLIRVYQTHFFHGTFLWIGSSLAQKFPQYVGANLGSFDLPIVVLYVGSMFINMTMMPAQGDPAMAQQQKTMSIMMTVFIAYYFMISRWASAFMVYYLFQNILNITQSYFMVYRPAKLAKLNGGVTLMPAPASPSITRSTPNVPRPRTAGTPVNPPRPRPRKKKR